MLYSDIVRDSMKCLFDPRFGLLGRVGVAAGKISGQLFRRIPFSRIRMHVAVLTVTRHLAQFVDDPGNKIVLDRMNKIARGELIATDIDNAFMNHELRELQLMMKGMKYEAAHEQTLK